MSTNIDEVLRQSPCPDCLRYTLRLELRLEARPLGTWSLSGAQPKTSAIEWPYAVCVADDCNFETRAKVVDHEDDRG